MKLFRFLVTSLVALSSLPLAAQTDTNQVDSKASIEMQNQVRPMLHHVDKHTFAQRCERLTSYFSAVDQITFFRLRSTQIRTTINDEISSRIVAVEPYGRLG